MDTILSALLSWQFLFFCIAIGAVVFVIKLVVEYAMVNWWPLKQWEAAHKESKIWRGLILPILPIALGLAAALLIKQYPYPEGFTSGGAKVVFGLVSGFSSSLIVRLYKSFLSSKVSEFAVKVSSMVKPTTTTSEEDVRNSIVKEDNP